MQKGFSLLELMVVLGIIILASSFSWLYLDNFTKERQLKLANESSAVVLRDAQQRSLIQENGKYWGVKFENLTSQNRYSLFSADDAFLNGFATTTTVYLRSALQFLQPPPANNAIILFDKITGNLANNPNCSVDFNNTSSTIVMSVRNYANLSSNIKVYCNGKIE